MSTGSSGSSAQPVFQSKLTLCRIFIFPNLYPSQPAWIYFGTRIKAKAELLPPRACAPQRPQEQVCPLDAQQGTPAYSHLPDH